MLLRKTEKKGRNNAVLINETFMFGSLESFLEEETKWNPDPDLIKRTGKKNISFASI